MSDTDLPSDGLRRARRGALLVAAGGLLVAVIGWIVQPGDFYRAYLFSWLLWLGVTLGSLSIVMLHHLTGGEWGVLVRRLGEAAAMTLPLMIVLFLPIAFGLHSLYIWARPEAVAADQILQHKQPYLNPVFFLVRSGIYGAIWLGMAWYLWRSSLRHDSTADPGLEFRMHHLSAVGMLVYFITMSFAGVDWIMSREPHWYSTVYGFMIICGQGLSGLAVLIAVLALLSKRSPFRELSTPERLNDLGNLLLTLVILWTYMAFVQLLVTWMGNKQEDIPWYTQRLSNGFWWIGVGLVLLHFFVPF